MSCLKLYTAPSRCSPAGKVFTGDMLTTIWIRIRNKLSCFETYLLFKCYLLLIITTFSMPIAVFSVILETIHSAIKMLASRTVFTRDIFTTIGIRIRSDFDLVGYGIIFPDFKPTCISARCSPAGTSLPGIYPRQSGSGSGRSLAWSDPE